MTLKERRDLLDQIERCIHEGHHLTKWEDNFLDAIMEKVDIYQELSEREREILDKIESDKVQ